MPVTGVRAFVFDLDGTMVDNMAPHLEAFARFGQRHGLPPLTMADRARIDGKRNAEVFATVFGRTLTDAEWRAFEDEKEALYRELSVGRLVPTPGLERLLALAGERDIAIAVATSAPRENVEHTLRELGLAHLLPYVARGDEVPHGKPAPDVFLAAARRIGVPPALCVAFEDAPMGIAAARRAGMQTCGLTTSFTRAQLEALDEPPHFVVGDFDEFLEGPGRWLLAPP
ncbi:MAG: HAD family phosphatase [Vicinamibacteraceae bacterium]|nr:HAD family phosphatase [Vicinamibacteraceae bacterium]